MALQLAQRDGAQLSVLMVVPDYTTSQFFDATLRDELEGMRDRLAAEGRTRLEATLGRQPATPAPIERVVIVSDLPYQEIVDASQRLNCDLIVMAARGHGPVKALLVGSQTSHVLALATVPVLVVK
jgi:nucleotide-binding universal stress UspA family protein